MLEFECQGDKRTSLPFLSWDGVLAYWKAWNYKHTGNFNKVILGQVEDFKTKDSTLSDAIVLAEGSQRKPYLVSFKAQDLQELANTKRGVGHCD